MHCKHCGFANGEDDHRCLRCGRRIGTAVAAPVSFTAGSYEGATALAPRLLPQENEVFENQQPALFAATAPPLQRLTQKIIPFAEIQRQAGVRSGQPQTPVVSQPKPAAKRNSRPVTEQENFDFVPSAAPRKMKDAVEAQIYCDLPVATPVHRFFAGALDAAMILLGFGLFFAMAMVTGSATGAGNVFGSGKLLWGTLGGALGIISIFYALLWVSARRETAGMNWSDLQLVTFDGFPLDGGNRIARCTATMMSFCSGGLGLLWALADAESLTWHDQISRTFPTIRSSRGSFVQQRQRR